MQNEGWSEVIHLQAQHVFRFQCHSITSLLMPTGEAELFGTEFPQNNLVRFRKGYEGSLITFSGSTFRYQGSNFKYYIVTFTEDNNCWNIYLNIHSSLELKRNDSLQDNNGPRVMICGNRNSGKKNLSQVLVNYKIRNFGRILFIDTNVNINHISIPGSLAAMVITKPYDIIDGWDINDEPIIFNFGDTNPLSDTELYMLQLKHLSDFVDERFDNDPELSQSGFILNMSSMEGDSEYEGNIVQRIALLLETIELFQINYIIVIGDGFLEQRLKPSLDKDVQILRIPKTAESSIRNESTLIQMYNFKVSSYFKGQGLYKLAIKSFRLISRSTSIYSFDSTDFENTDRLTNPQKMKINKHFMNSFLAVSQAKNLQDLAVKPIYGYVMVIEVSHDLTSFKVITPSGAPVPSRMFLFTKFKMYF